MTTYVLIAKCAYSYMMLRLLFFAILLAASSAENKTEGIPRIPDHVELLLSDQRVLAGVAVAAQQPRTLASSGDSSMGGCASILQVSEVQLSQSVITPHSSLVLITRS